MYIHARIASSLNMCAIALSVCGGSVSHIGYVYMSYMCTCSRVG